jgi:hypothetical protein
MDDRVLPPFFQRIEFDHDPSNPRKQVLEEQVAKVNFPLVMP